MVRERERGEQKSKRIVFGIVLGMTPHLENDSKCISTEVSIPVTKIWKKNLVIWFILARFEGEHFVWELKSKAKTLLLIQQKEKRIEDFFTAAFTNSAAFFIPGRQHLVKEHLL